MVYYKSNTFESITQDKKELRHLPKKPVHVHSPNHYLLPPSKKVLLNFIIVAFLNFSTVSSQLFIPYCIVWSAPNLHIQFRLSFNLQIPFHPILFFAIFLLKSRGSTPVSSPRLDFADYMLQGQVQHVPSPFVFSAVCYLEPEAWLDPDFNPLAKLWVTGVFSSRRCNIWFCYFFIVSDHWCSTSRCINQIGVVKSSFSNYIITFPCICFNNFIRTLSSPSTICLHIRVNA